MLAPRYSYFWLHLVTRFLWIYGERDDKHDALRTHGQVDEAEVVSINSWLFLFRG